MDANHAIIPLTHLIELEECAYNTPTSVSDRALGTLQVAVFFGSVGACIWGWYKAQSLVQKEKHDQTMTEIDAKFHPKK